MSDTRTRFARCLEEVLSHEGGFADHPRDPGGATNLGITLKTLARWRNVHPWWSLGKDAVRALGRTEAAAIYKALYWDPIKAQGLEPGLDLALFDFSVNSGPSRAVKALQAELKVRADGAMGPITLGALKARIATAGVAALIDALCGRRLSFLQRLATFATFGRGWTARVAAVRRAALALAGQDAPQTLPQPNDWRPSMSYLSGYKTYIIAAFMVLAGLMQMLGVDLPALDGQSAGELMMEAFAIIFLRRGIRTEIGNA